jgi:molecular chaperone DnaK (HSP70)
MQVWNLCFKNAEQLISFYADFVQNTPKEYVLSVPAIWSDKAKDRTISCAFDAGYGERGDPSSIRLVSEPEAAAVYTITTVSRR